MRSVQLKSLKEIALMREPARVAREALHHVAELIKTGERDCFVLDKEAELFIRKHKCRPAFKNYNPPFSNLIYDYTLCISINEEVVHGLPLRGKIIEDGDVVSLDVGTEMNGWFADTALTVLAGESENESALNLIYMTEQTLMTGIEYLGSPKASIRGLAETMETFIGRAGYDMCHSLSGHGIGKSIHEAPNVPNRLDCVGFEHTLIVPGMVLCLEPMVAQGSGAVKQMSDGWTVKTKDGSLAAHFEHVVAVTENHIQILTEI